jgi:type IV secretory pathway VirB9-like protein
MSESPFTFNEARIATRQAANAQAESEHQRAQAVERYAAAEREYRKALSQTIVRLHSEGIAWTATGDIAKGEVAKLKYERDVAQGMREVAEQRAFRTGADRRSLDQLVQWSMKRELADPGSGG